MSKLNTAKAAAILGWDVLFLRAGLKAGKFNFGEAANVGGKKRWTFKIYPEAFKRFAKENYGIDVVLEE